MVDDEEASFWASVAELVDLEEDEVPVDDEEVWRPGTTCVVVIWL
jgi:hypothetical protein